MHGYLIAQFEKILCGCNLFVKTVLYDKGIISGYSIDFIAVRGEHDQRIIYTCVSVCACLSKVFLYNIDRHVA